MARMTEEEAAYWDDYYTKNPPTPGPNGTGLFARRKAALAAEAAKREAAARGTETYTVTVDKTTADFLVTKAVAAHKTPEDIIGEMVQEQIAAIM